MKRPLISLFGFQFTALAMKELVELIDHTIQSGQRMQYVGLNAMLISLAKTDPCFAELINKASLICPDGQSIVWASKLLGKPLPERIATPDLMLETIQLAKQKGYKVFLLGAKPEVVNQTADKLASLYSPEVIAGYHHGYFDLNTEGEDVALQIAQTQANIVFVAITSPKKEEFIARFGQTSQATFFMGVGGAFDIVSGKITRAPKFMQHYCLEWVYRLYKEPRRLFMRYLTTNSHFIYLTIKEILRNKQTTQ